MKRYTIYKAKTELRGKISIDEYDVQLIKEKIDYERENSERWPDILYEGDNREEAEAAFNRLKKNYSTSDSGSASGHTYITELQYEEEELDEDGEYIDTIDYEYYQAPLTFKENEVRNILLSKAQEEESKYYFISQNSGLYRVSDKEVDEEYLSFIHDVIHKSFKDIIIDSDMTQAEFAKEFFIPKRTVESWCMGDRECPVYVRLLIMTVLHREVLRLKGDEKRAGLEALKDCGFTADRMEEMLRREWLTFNNGRDGNTYAWLFFDDNTESCVRVSDLTRLDKDEIDKLLC